MDAIKIIGIYGIFVALPFYLVGLMWWFWFWVVLGLVVALAELLVKLVKGKTLSQRFWAWAKQNPWREIYVLASLTVFYVYLLLHLWIRL